MDYKIDRFLTIIFQYLFDSIDPWIEYSNQNMCFTVCNSPTKWLQKNVKIDYFHSDFIVEKHFFHSYFNNWLNWLQLKRCRTFAIEPGYKTKFKLLLKMYDTPFHSEKMQENIMNTFMKLQRTYRALNRFAFLWKFKRAHMSVTTDLYFVDIDLEKDSTFILYQNNTKFSFKITELLRIIESALCHQFEDNFEIISQYPKNPYNKVVLEYHNLCNIYHHMMIYTKMNIPIFFQLWYKEKFNLTDFKQKYELLLTELCVKNYTSTIDVKSDHIYRNAKQMISGNRFTSRWNIHQNFSKEKVIQKVKHCLFEYFMINLNINMPTDMLTFYETELHKKLKRMYFQDSKFGIIRKNLSTENKIGFHVLNTPCFVFDPNSISTTGTFVFGSSSSDVDLSGNIENTTSKRNKKRVFRRRSIRPKKKERKGNSLSATLNDKMYDAFNLLEDSPNKMNHSWFSMKELYGYFSEDEEFSQGRNQEDNNELFSLTSRGRRINDILPSLYQLQASTTQGRNQEDNNELFAFTSGERRINDTSPSLYRFPVSTEEIDQVLLASAAETLLMFSENRIRSLERRLEENEEEIQDSTSSSEQVSLTSLETKEEILPSIASLFSNE